MRCSERNPIKDILLFIQTVKRHEAESKAINIINEATYLINALVTETLHAPNEHLKLIGDQEVSQGLITHYLAILSSNYPSGSLVGQVLEALDIVLKCSPEATAFYLQNDGESIVERWAESQNQQLASAAGQFAREHHDSCRISDEAAMDTQQVSQQNKIGRSDRYFDDEAEEAGDEVFTYMI